MRIHVVSDLHFEFRDDYGRQLGRQVGEAVQATKADVLVVAGDLATARLIYTALENIVKWCPVPVLYVTGNHEHYGSSIGEVRRALRALPATVIPLDNDYYEIDRIRFVGGTGWFPYKLDNVMYEHLISDFSEIKKLRRDYPMEHEDFRKVVADCCRPGDVVISHHLPTQISVPDRFARSKINRFFVGEFEDLMNDYKPAVWIHGHTHDSCDYRLNATRIVCNPLGYPRERPTPYNFMKVIDL